MSTTNLSNVTAPPAGVDLKKYKHEIYLHRHHAERFIEYIVEHAYLKGETLVYWYAECVGYAGCVE